LAGLYIDGHKAAIKRAPDGLAIPVRGATVADVAAQAGGRKFARYLRVVLPQLLAGPHVERVGLAPRRGDDDAAVDDQRRGLVAATFGQLGMPGDAQLRYVVGVDLLERAVALLAVIAT